MSGMPLYRHYHHITGKPPKFGLLDSVLIRRIIPHKMTPQERDRMNILVIRIQHERDPKIFDELVAELNELIAAKSQRLNPKNSESGRQ
jgi:hypothetical protein